MFQLFCEEVDLSPSTQKLQIVLSKLYQISRISVAKWVSRVKTFCPNISHLNILVFLFITHWVYTGLFSPNFWNPSLEGVTNDGTSYVETSEGIFFFGCVSHSYKPNISGTLYRIFLLSHSFISFSSTKMFNIDCFFVLVFGVWQQLDSDMDGNYDTSSHDWAGTEKASASAIFAQTDPLHNRYTHCTICVPLLRCTDATKESCISRSQLRNQAQSCECKDLLGDWQPLIESQ